MIRVITITPALNGFIVMVGCQTLVFSSVGDLLMELSNYLREPEATERKFLQHSINADKLPKNNTPPAYYNPSIAANPTRPMSDFSPVSFEISESETGRIVSDRAGIR